MNTSGPQTTARAFHLRLWPRSCRAFGDLECELIERRRFSNRVEAKIAVFRLPSKDDERAEELLESKRENLTLRAELRRQEERDILKKAAAYFARESG